MPTIADAMKSQGYATGQFGKNHLGDQDQHLPTIEDTGPLNIARMPIVDEEFLGAAKTFIKGAVKADTPFFCWFNFGLGATKNE